MRSNPLPYLLTAMLAAIVVFVGTVSALDRPPLSYPDEPFLIESPVVQGEPIVVTVPRCNLTDRDLHTTSNRILVNLGTGERWGTPDVPVGNINMKPGCEVVGPVALYLLPPNLPPGRYRLETTSTVQGSIRVFNVHHVSTEFDVLPAVPTGVLSSPSLGAAGSFWRF